MIDLLVKSDGIYLITEMPEGERKTCGGKGFCCDWNTPCKALEYDNARRSAEDSAIFVQDQDQAKSLIVKTYTDGNWSKHYPVGTIYLVSGWRYEIKHGCEKCGAHYSASEIDCRNGYCEKRKVATIIEETPNHPGKPDTSSGEKPDFEAMALQMSDECKEGNHIFDCPCSAIAEGMEKIWDTHVLHLQSENTRRCNKINTIVAELYDANETIEKLREENEQLKVYQRMQNVTANNMVDIGAKLENTINELREENASLKAENDSRRFC